MKILYAGLREGNQRRGSGPGDGPHVRIAQKKYWIPGTGDVEMGPFFNQQYVKRYVKFYLESPVSQREKSP